MRKLTDYITRERISELDEESAKGIFGYFKDIYEYDWDSSDLRTSGRSPLAIIPFDQGGMGEMWFEAWQHSIFDLYADNFSGHPQDFLESMPYAQQTIFGRLDTEESVNYYMGQGSASSSNRFLTCISNVSQPESLESREADISVWIKIGGQLTKYVLKPLESVLFPSNWLYPFGILKVDNEPGPLYFSMTHFGFPTEEQLQEPDESTRKQERGTQNSD